MVYSAETQSGPRAVIRDLINGWKQRQLWRAFAWDETKNRYRRSALGLAWIVISYVIFVAAISLFFGGFSQMGPGGFVHYVALGLVAFTFLVGNLTDGCTVFRQAAGWIKSTNLPYSVYVFKSIARSLLPFALQATTALIVIALFGWRPSWHILLVLPAVALFLINAFWVQLLVGHISARLRDVEHLVGSLTRIFFFTSPVMWVYEERTGLVRTIASYNPLTHFIQIFRAPLLGTTPDLNSYIFVGVFTLLGWTAAIAGSAVMRRRLPYWV